MKKNGMKCIWGFVTVILVLVMMLTSCGKQKPERKGVSGAKENKSAISAQKDRFILLKIDKLDNGLPIRVLVSSEQLGGIKFTTPGSGFRMSFSLTNMMPEITYKTAGSEFLLQPGLLIIGKHIVSSDKDFPALLKIRSNGELIWLAGNGVVQPKDGFPMVQNLSTDIEYYITLMKSSYSIDREEAAYSLGILARPLQDRSKILDLLKRALKDSDDFVRLTAAEALASVGDKTTLPILQGVAEKDESDWVREVAGYAIEVINKGASAPKEGNSYWLPWVFEEFR